MNLLEKTDKEILKIADPKIVAKPLLNPSTSRKKIRKKKAVKNSGSELPIALIVAPLTPSVNLLPITLEYLSKLSHDFQRKYEEIIIRNTGIATCIK